MRWPGRSTRTSRPFNADGNALAAARRRFATSGTQLALWWSERYARPPNHPLYLQESAAYWKEVFYLEAIQRRDRTLAEAKAIAELSEGEGPEVDVKAIRDQVVGILDRVNAFNVLLGDPAEEIVEAEEVTADGQQTPGQKQMPGAVAEASVAEARRILAQRKSRRPDRWDELQRGAQGREHI